jgi:dihydroorotate dehydrogenase electron transfer subunit
MDPRGALIVENREISADIFRLRLKTEGPDPAAAPGRFFMIGLNQGTDPLLRRPLSHLSAAVDGHGVRMIEFIYEVRGRGTWLLSKMKPPAAIDYIGPLGRGWDLDPVPKKVIMVAGGVGAVPLYAAAVSLARAEPRPELEFIYGARTGSGLVLEPEIGEIVAGSILCTEDGCRGEKGLATDFLKRSLNGRSAKDALILACGPRAMLKKVAGMAREQDVPCQVSLEARMACGMGACLTCSIKGAGGNNLRVCKDGPVFDARAVDWEALDDFA